MPELPDVETWKRYVAATALHQQIGDVEVDAPRMMQGLSKQRLKNCLKGNRFSATRRHGKFLFVGAEQNAWLILHFGMTGFLKYWKRANEAPAGARLSVRFSNGYRLSGAWPRRLGRISLTDDPGRFIDSQELGPDPLESGIDPDTFVRMLRNRRGSLKSALMDQKFLAGIGNVYSDEMLFQARLDPRTSPSDLRASDLKRLYKAMHHVLHLAIERQADPERLPDSWILPRRNRRGRCPRCKRGLQRIGISGRTAYVCPVCQEAA